MVSKSPALDVRLLRKRCVACGYDGALLREGTARTCARCGCDLRRRPARSYVEMEGLDGHAERSARRRTPRVQVEPRLRHRWTAFLLMAFFSLIMIIYLAAAAFSV